jgi:hypothetical protein
VPRSIAAKKVTSKRTNGGRTRGAKRATIRSGGIPFHHDPGGGQQDYMVLRTVYMTPSTDEYLRVRASRERKSKNQLIRELITHAQESDPHLATQ